MVVEQAAPVLFEKGSTSFSLRSEADEYFYGGGVNGRFSLGEKVIPLRTRTAGRMAAWHPLPFYWSTGGYGVMWHTLQEGPV